MRYLLLVAMALSAFGIAAYCDDPKPKPKAERFDHVVREDIFAGFNGDNDKMERGLKACEETLAKNPKHAEALVWRGAVKLFQSGQAFQKQDMEKGLKLWTEGLKDMDDAVALEPKSVSVRIPRAAALMPTIRFAPEEFTKDLKTKAKEDFETILELQKKDLDKLGTHPRGELRMGLADIYRKLGESEKSKAQLEMIVKELPDSKYSERAKEWLAAKADAKLHHSCIGCHKDGDKK